MSFTFANNYELIRETLKEVGVAAPDPVVSTIAVMYGENEASRFVSTAPGHLVAILPGRVAFVEWEVNEKPDSIDVTELAHRHVVGVEVATNPDWMVNLAINKGGRPDPRRGNLGSATVSFSEESGRGDLELELSGMESDDAILELVSEFRDLMTPE